MMKSRNPDIAKYVNEFDKFAEIGKKKVNQYKNKKITAEDFKNWLEKF